MLLLQGTYDKKILKQFKERLLFGKPRRTSQDWKKIQYLLTRENKRLQMLITKYIKIRLKNNLNEKYNFWSRVHSMIITQILARTNLYSFHCMLSTMVRELYILL